MPAIKRLRTSTRAKAIVAVAAAVLMIAGAGGDAGQRRAEGAAPSPALTEIDAVNPQVAAALQPYAALLRPVLRPTQPLPADPQADLVEATRQLAAGMRFPFDPGPAIRAAAIPREVAGRLAILVRRMVICQANTAGHQKELIALLPKLFRSEAVLAQMNYPDIVPCAEQLWIATRELELGLQAAAGSDPGRCHALPAGEIDLWPVLRFSPGCDSQTYRNDYLLIVDVGGDDVYNNNVGSNVLDINYSPPGAPIPGLQGTGPAKGCQRGLSGLTRKDCSLGAAVLLDMSGSDTYGVLEAPDSDAICTRDAVVRRMVTGGAGFLGVGIVRDAATSNDKYVGKTISLGAGHLFGVGILSDAGGDDSYLAVRNSEGFALVGGLGLLHDEAGDDHYDYYMPRPLDPTIPNQNDGAGGVRDNEGDGVCDRIPRNTLGSANLLAGAIGVLLDGSGDDTYGGAFAPSYETHPAIPGMEVTGGCLGYGGSGGLGVFYDRSGHDTYRIDSPPNGITARGDGVVIQPGGPSTDAPGKGYFAGGRGIFIDR